MHTDLFGVHHFLHRHLYFIDLAVVIGGFNHCCPVPARVEPVDETSCFPFVLSHYFLCLVIDVVDRSDKGFALAMSESVISCDWTHVVAFNQLIVPREIFFSLMREIKLSFTNHSSVFLKNVVVVHYSICIFGVGFVFVAVSHNRKNSLGIFPHLDHSKLEIVDVVRLSESVVDLDCCQSAVGVVSEVPIPEFNLSLVLLFEPNNHRMIVAFFDRELIVPLVVFGLISRYRAASFCVLG